ncbi:winged helix-turn-helix domain-containing protein [Buttiauxella agrestis]|uniref:OmpR/PhoB-type domain-containing protein n=1 Tax=Buttiauxella agrestis ATCC 33320 TaxID=1006004 RepID=A0A085FYX0_9ENTR|nr:hypothetical protein [Buttiauxella agrestis]KFC76665.1 hypothetical protein GBAG_4385 [Buttiauxella agrestis ATCC 33320]
MADKYLYGYLIGRDIQVDVINHRVIHFPKGKGTKIIRMLYLRDTMMRLLVFLLKNSNVRIISYNEIMMNVWEMYNLSSSNQRLWQVLHELENKLHSIGVMKGFFSKIEKKGISVNAGVLTTLYYIKI